MILSGDLNIICDFSKFLEDNLYSLYAYGFFLLLNKDFNSGNF